MYTVSHIDRTHNLALVDELLAVFDRVLGAGYLTAERLQELALRPDAVVLVACDSQGRVVGGATASPMPESLAVRLVEAAGSRALPATPLPNLGLLRANAVLRAHRGHGIGGQLLDQRLAWLAERGMTHATCLVWADSPSGPSRLLARRGFRRAASLPGWWRGQSCLVCGDDCFCAAELMAAGPLRVEPVVLDVTGTAKVLDPAARATAADELL